MFSNKKKLHLIWFIRLDAVMPQTDITVKMILDDLGLSLKIDKYIFYSALYLYSLKLSSTGAEFVYFFKLTQINL